MQLFRPEVGHAEFPEQLFCPQKAYRKHSPKKATKDVRG